MCKFLSTGSEINSNFTKFKAKDTQELIFCWRPPHPHADICTKTVWTRHNFVYLIILFLSTKQYENSNMSWGYPCRKHKYFNTFITISQCFKIFLTLEVSWWNKCTCLQARVDSFRSKPVKASAEQWLSMDVMIQFWTTLSSFGSGWYKVWVVQYHLTTTALCNLLKKGC